jgi:hypothetical protein
MGKKQERIWRCVVYILGIIVLGIAIYGVITASK